MNCVDYFLENSANLDKDFIVGPKEQLSFKDLKRFVYRLSAWIKDDIGQEKNILLMSPNSSFFIVSYLAIIKSGNVCVPLNQNIENDNLNYIVERAESNFIFTTEQIYTKLGLTLQLVSQKMFEGIIIDENIIPDRADDTFNKDCVAEIIFTSGSTALPKGVMLSHNNLMANTESIIKYLKLNQSDTILVVLPFFYCYGLSLLHTHLRVGGSVVLNNSFILISSVVKDLLQYNCTGFAGVPSHFQILLRKSDSFINGKFPNLRYVTQAGGKLHDVFINEFRNHFSDIDFYIMYGQTEATARLSYLPPDMLDEKLGSVGRGIPDTVLKVVDVEGHAVEPGDLGEIIAKGDNVMLGYYKDDVLTHHTLRNGWLYTGDLATIDEDGYIFVKARKKEIIKVGGKRVSPKEVEEVILSMPQIIDCTITSIEDDILGEALKAKIVKKTDAVDLDINKVKRYCSSKLALYKIPTVIEFVEKVQVNSAGKKVKEAH